MDTRATNAVLTHDNDHITYAPNNPLLDVEHEDQDNENDVHYWTRREMSVNVPSLIVLTVLAYACRNITAISIVSQASEYNWDKSQMGLVLSCFYIGYVSTQIISGFLSDYIGGNQVITLAAIGWGITTIVYPYCVDVSRDQSTQLAIIVVIRTIFAILQGFHYPAVANVVASKIHIRNRTCIYTCFAAGLSIGLIVSGSIGSLLLERLNWRSLYYVFGTLTIVWAIATRILVLKRKCAHPCKMQNVEKDTVQQRSMKEIWKLLLCHRAFWGMVWCNVCIGYTWHLVYSWFPAYLEERYPSEKGWVFNVLPWTIHAPSSVASGYIADWLIANYCSITLARKYIQLFSAIVYASCMFAIGYSTTFVSALGLFCACACADGLTAGGAYSNPQDLAPNHTGALYGVMNTLAALPGFISVYSSGILLKHFGSWVPVFSIAGGVMVTGTITFLAMGSGKRIV